MDTLAYILFGFICGVSGTLTFIVAIMLARALIGSIKDKRNSPS